MNNKARQHISATFIVILLVICIFSSFYNFPIQYVRADAIPPTIVINFAGNLSDSGGAYWSQWNETTAYIGVWGNGSYTNDSRQQEDWMYINCTVSDGDGVANVWLNWYNLTGDVWTNWTYAFLNPNGDWWEYNTSGNVQVNEGYDYSFDVVANDTIPNSVTREWNKTAMYGDIGATHITRRYVQLNCTTTNISYSPFYVLEKNETHSDPEDDYKKDRLHHDQGTDGTSYDTGYLLNDTLNDDMNFIRCSLFTGNWFDESVCTESFTLDNIYYHVWWEDNDDHIRIRWKKYRQQATSDDNMLNDVDLYDNTAVSNITYDNGNATWSNDYHLNTGLIDVDNTDFTDNSIYELYVQFHGLTYHYPSTICNISIQSFVLFNVPDNATLDAMHNDTDGDGLWDRQELYETYTNPFLADTDNDGVNDYNEVQDGTDPNNWTDLGGSVQVTTNTTTGVEEQNATLHGYLANDGGETCRVGFEWGMNTSYGHTDFDLSLASGQNPTSGYSGNEFFKFPKDIWLYNSTVNSSNTCENFFDDIIGNINSVFRYINGVIDTSWILGEPHNTLEYIDNSTDQPTYTYNIFMDNIDTLNFTYDDLTATTGDEYGHQIGIIGGVSLYGLSPGTLYHYRAFATNSTGTAYGTDSAFLTKPLVSTGFSYLNNHNHTTLNLSWTKGTGANNTYIERNTSVNWSRGEGTLVYNNTANYYNNTGLTANTTYYYQLWSYTNWTYNPTVYQWSDANTSATATTAALIVDPPYNGSGSYDIGTLTVNLTWSRGNYSDREIVIQNNNTWATSPTDGWVRQNDTTMFFNESITYHTYFTVWSYNVTYNIYSATGLNIPWGGVLKINCYDEETNDSLYFDVFISNQDGSQTYESRNNTNPHYLIISELPTGDDIKITVSAASNYSEKSETSYWNIDENQTITYIVLSQTADSKSSTNVTCINESSGHHSYPPFTLVDDLVAILPDNADNFTKIFVNYTHEEYSSRLYYRDIDEASFSILNTYLPPTENKQLYLLEVIDEASNTVSDAYIEVKRSVNGTFVVVSRLLTDANGQADINLISDRNYIFVISKEGYVTENASWTPSTDIFTHTFRIIWEVIPFEPDTFGDIISFYGTLYVNNTMMVTFYDLDNGMIDSHFTVYENYNGTLTYMGEYNGTTSNDITFWINVTNATRLHIIVLYMNHSTLGEVINYRIFVYPIRIDRVSGTWLENLIISVVGEFDYGYVLTLIWVLPCVLLIAGLASIGHPGTGILGAGLYSFWITWNITLPEEAKILTFASIAIVTGFITIFLVKGTKVVHS